MFSLPDIKDLLHTRLSAAIGHLIDLGSLNEEQFQVSLSGMTSRLELRGVGLKVGVVMGSSTAVLKTLPGGRIGSFSVSIPLSTLVRKTQKIEVCLHGLEVVVGVEDAVGVEEARIIWAEEKRKRLLEESGWTTAGLEGEADGTADGTANPSSTNTSVLSSLVKRIVSMGLARLQLNVRDVRVRVVDMKTGNEVVECWVDRVETVETAETVGVDDDSLLRVPAPLDRLVEGLMISGASKVVRVEAAGVRWCGGKGDRRDRGNQTSDHVATSATKASMDCTLHALYNITTAPSQVLLRARFDRMEATVDMEEMGEIVALAEDMEWRGVRRRVAHLKPLPLLPTTDSISTFKLRFDAREMWRFAINSVLLEMSGPVRFAAWRPENEVVRDRRRYILLYRKMHDVRASMSAIGERELARLEERLSMSDIAACRAVALGCAGWRERRVQGAQRLESCIESADSVTTRRAQAALASSTISSTSSTLWSKIPALAEMEERLFQALDVEESSALGGEGADDDLLSDETTPSLFDLQVLAVVQVPRASASMHCNTFGLDASMLVSDVVCGYVNDVRESDVDVSSMPPMSNTAYAMMSMPNLEVSTKRDTHMRLKSPLNVEYIGMDNVVRVDLSQGMEMRVAPEDIRGMIDSIPAASQESYSMHWIETAISMEKKAYCIETVRRLQRLGNFVDFDARLGPTVVDVEGLDIRIGLHELTLRTAMESDNFEELRRIYRIISSWGITDTAEVADTGVGGGATSSPSSNAKMTSAKSAMQALEDRLIYKEVDVTLSKFHVEHDGVPVVYPLHGTAKTKINRLYGDFSHPQVVAELILGKVSVDMFDACLASFFQLHKALESSESAPADAWRIQRTISVGAGWPSARVRWLADDDTFRHQFSVDTGRSAVSARMSFPHSKSADASLDVSDFRLLHSKGMESIRIPMVDVQIPYFARSFSLDRLAFGMKDRPKSMELQFESTGIALAGDGKDTSNYIRSTTQAEASIRASYVERAGEPSTVDVTLSNLDIGHGTLMRAVVLSQLLASPESEQDEGWASSTVSPRDGSKSDIMRLALVVQNIQCSFVHEMTYGGVSTTPVQYHDFSAIHSTVAQVRLAKLDLRCDVGEKTAIQLLDLDSLSVSCGMLRERGAVLGIIFSVPQIRCHIGSLGAETLLDCPQIDAGISPYQIALIKGVSDLVAFDQSRYTSFYGATPGTASSGTMPTPARPNSARSTKSPSFTSIGFDPVRVVVGALNVCALGAVPSAGSVWLWGRSITVGVKPGDVRLVWETLDLSHCRQKLPSNVSLGGSCSGSGVGSASPTGSDSDGSSVVYHDVARTFTSGSSGSSKFFDAMSMVSRGVSESSFVTSFYSADECEDSGKDGTLWEHDDVIATAPPLPNKDDVSNLLRVCFDWQPDMGAVLTMVTDNHVVASLSSIRVHVGVDASAQAVQFARTYERYLSNHIFGVVSRTLSDAPVAGGSVGGNLETKTSTPPLLRELHVEADRVTILMETQDTNQADYSLGVSASSISGKPAELDGSKTPGTPRRHAISLSLGSRLRYTDEEDKQSCSVDLRGLFISSFSASGETSDLGDVDTSVLESHALIGNRDLSIQCSWAHGTVSYDVACCQISAWLNELNLIPVMRVVATCRAAADAMRAELAGDDVDAFHDRDISLTGDDGAPSMSRGSGRDSSIAARLSVRRVSFALASHALSRQKKHLCEVDLNNISLFSTYHEGNLHATASLGVEAAASKVSDGSWIAMLDETTVGVEAAVASGVLALKLDVGPSNFTVTSDIVASMALSSMVANLVESAVSSTPGPATSPAPYLTICQLINEATCNICVVLDDAENGVHILEPGASLFPRQATSLPYRAGTPNAELGVVGLGRSIESSIRPLTASAPPNRRAAVWAEGFGPDHGRVRRVGGTADKAGFDDNVLILGDHSEWIALESESTVYRAFKNGEIVLHTSKSTTGTWTTWIRPCIRFRNDADFPIDIGITGSDEVLATARSGEDVWLPVSAVFGEYRLRTKTSDWCDSVRLVRTMASRGYVQRVEAIFRDGPAVISVPLTISGWEGSVFISASPKLDIRNLMPLPVEWSFNAHTPLCSVQPGCRFTVPSSRCNFPLAIEFSLDGFSDTKCVVVSEMGGSPVLKWKDSGWNEYVESLDVAVAMTQMPSGAGELYGRLTASKDATSGTIIVSLIAPVWVYNYAGVPISFDCLVDAATTDASGGSASIRPEAVDVTEAVSAISVGLVEDIVPDAWIPPLQPTSPTSGALVTARSLCTHCSLPDIDGGGIDPAVGPFDALGADQGLASISGDMDIGLEITTGGGHAARQRLSTMSGASMSLTSIPSPGGSFHYSVAGLGSLVSHERTPMSVRDADEAESSMTGTMMRHLLSAEHLGYKENAPRSGATTPTGLNTMGVHVMGQSVKRLRIRVARQKARLGSSYWSSSVALDAHRWHDVVLAPLPPVTTGMHLYNTRKGEYPVIVSLKRDDDLTQDLPLNMAVHKLIVRPQFVMINQLGIEIHYRQQGTFIDTIISADDFSAVHWTDVGLPRKLSVRIHEAGWMWSGGFSLDNAGDIFVKLRHRDRGVTQIVRVEISHSSEDGTKKIILRSNPEAFTPYRLDNCSLETLTIRQKGVVDQQDILRPYCSLDYTWDEPSMAHLITVERPGGKVIGSFDLDKVGFEEVIGGKIGALSRSRTDPKGVPKLVGRSTSTSTSPSTLVVRVTAEGPIRVLTVMDLAYHQRVPRTTDVIDKKDRDFNELEIRCSLDTVSLSVIHLGKERLFFGVRRLDLSCLVSSSRMAISGSIRSISLENTSRASLYPVIFALPAPESTLSSHVRRGVGDSDPIKWNFSLWRDFREHHGMLCFDVAEIFVRSFSIYIEQDLINLLMDMSTSSAWSNPGSMPAASRRARTPTSPSFLDMSSLNATEKFEDDRRAASLGGPGNAHRNVHPHVHPKFYFDRITVSPMEFMISFSSSVADDWNDWSGVLLQQAIALADIEDARVWLSGIQLSNTLFDQQTMSSYVAAHYRRALILEIFKLVGAANVLGDPMATVQHIGLGFWEFVSFPALGLVQSFRTLSPSAFVLGCVQGTKGLLQNVLFAVSNATSKASSAAHKTIRLTWGDDVGSNPCESLVAATLRGMIGLFTDPIKGAEDGGLSGFLFGIRHGALGAVLIPTSAWLHMFASLTLSIRKAVAGTSNVGWSRPPRISELPYDWTESMGRWLFTQLQDSNADGKGDEYVCCARLHNDKDMSIYLILTTGHVLAARAEGLSWTPRMAWSSRLEQLEAVTLEEAEKETERETGTFTLRLVANPEPVRINGLRELRRRSPREERKLYTVFEADFARQGHEAADFRMHLQHCREARQLQRSVSSSRVYL